MTTEPAPSNEASPRPRTALVSGAVVLLLALLYMLPQREAQVEQGPIQTRVLELPALQLDEPPGWARQRGIDEVVRHLDRMGWGSHQVLVSSRDSLRRFAGQLAPEILARLEAIGPGDPVLAAKLIELLGNEDPTTPGLVDELLRRALSHSVLVSKAALRVLARVDDERAVEGIVARLFDPDPDLQAHARGGLAERARQGDRPAQAIILDELDLEAGNPDLAFLAVVPDFGPSDDVIRVLRRVVENSGGAVRLVALTALLKLGDVEAEQAFTGMLAGDDVNLHIEALNSAFTAGRVLGEPEWERIVRNGSREELLPLARVLTLSVDTAHASAAHAMILLEFLASDPLSPVRSDVTAALYYRRHVWAVEATRQQLQQAIGPELSLAADRVIDGPVELTPDFVELALERVADPDLPDPERLVLFRLLSHVAPEQSAQRLLDFARRDETVSPALMDAFLPMLAQLGPDGILLMGEQLTTNEDKGLFVYLAAQVGSGAALPGLKRILLDEDTPPGLRQDALDCIARLRDGPREEALREVLAQLHDPALSDRAFLLFWNYL